MKKLTLNPLNSHANAVSKTIRGFHGILVLGQNGRGHGNIISNIGHQTSHEKNYFFNMHGHPPNYVGPNELESKRPQTRKGDAHLGD